MDMNYLNEWKELPKVVSRELLVKSMEVELSKLYDYYKVGRLERTYIGALKEAEMYRKDIAGLPSNEVQTYHIEMYEEAKETMRETYKEMVEADLVLDSYRNAIELVKKFEVKA